MKKMKKRKVSEILLKIYPLIVTMACVTCGADESGESKITLTKRSEPVWEGTFTAADPSIVRDGDTLRMYYSSLVLDPEEKLVIAGAKSVDGIHWIPANEVENAESIALNMTPGTWDDHLEAVSVIKTGNELWMYYCGYPDEADVVGMIVAEGQIGLAKSGNTISFERTFSDPILSLGATNAKDANALFSPTIIKEGDTYYMLYVGYCIEDCSPAFIGILGATSPDGETWTKLNDPIISGTDFDLDWAEVIKEPALVKGPDNMFYLFISGDTGIGVARSSNILGPYEVYPEPILEKEHDWESYSVIAPTVIIEDNKVRMWYMGVTVSGTGADFAIGYAETSFPLLADW
jgi:beta-xylosidase